MAPPEVNTGQKSIREGLTFDDVLLAPRYSAVHPKDTDVRTRFARGIHLNIPLVSAAMDTVTGAQMAIAMAREGGLGVIHKNLSIAEQAAKVDRVKRSESGMIENPYTLGPDRPIRDARRLMETRGVSGVPVVDDAGRVLGIITNRDLLFETDGSRSIAIFTAASSESSIGVCACTCPATSKSTMTAALVAPGFIERSLRKRSSRARLDRPTRLTSATRLPYRIQPWPCTAPMCRTV